MGFLGLWKLEPGSAGKVAGLLQTRLDVEADI